MATPDYGVTVNSDLLRKGRLSPEDERALSDLLSQVTISTPGMMGLQSQSPSQSQIPTTPLPAGPQNFVRSSSGSTIDLDYAAVPRQEGPREVGRRQLPDGTSEVLRKVPFMTDDGRQSMGIRREIETPAHLDPNELKRLEYEKKVTELQNLRNPRKVTEANWQKFEAKDGKLYELDTKSGAVRPMVLGGQGQMEAALSPSEQKEQKSLNQAKRAAQGVSTLAEELQRQYLKLQAAGGTTDPSKSVGENVAAWARATAPGQMVGRMTGAANQQILDEIANTRPLLMAMIAQSTGIAATQLNSNAELQFYLQAATDPTAGPQANLNALRRIDQMYGTGLAQLLVQAPGADAGQAPVPPPTQPMQPPPQVPQQIAPAEKAQILFDAVKAVKQGADSGKVAERLRAKGIDPREAGL